MSLDIFEDIFSPCICNSDFKLLHSNRKCAKWVDISSCKWTELVALWSTSSLMPHMIFKICSHFLENAFVEKYVKILSPQKFRSFECFQSGAPHSSYPCNNPVENLVKDSLF